MKYVCITCDQEFPDGIPDGAVELIPRSRGRRVNAYRLADGTIHSLREVRPLSAKRKHSWHKTPVVFCEFCFPPPPKVEPEKLPDPEPPVAQLEAPVPEPQITVEEVKRTRDG